MSPAPDVDRVAPGVFIWQNYDPAVKADLFSTAIETEAGLFIVDPIELEEGALHFLSNGRKVAGVIISSANHIRAAGQFARNFSVRVFAHPELATTSEFGVDVALSENEGPAKDLRVIFIDGAAAGEIALHCEHEEGMLIVGDALINFGSRGFDFLPAKYCSNGKQMRRSLRKLLDLNFERIFFAHGTPILVSARARLEALLNENADATRP
jgi:glyoxylase-like metal-dependent hydrolase (beta-lactamase superfamily II)